MANAPSNKVADELARLRAPRGRRRRLAAQVEAEVAGRHGAVAARRRRGPPEESRRGARRRLRDVDRAIPGRLLLAAFLPADPYALRIDRRAPVGRRRGHLGRQRGRLAVARRGPGRRELVFLL